MPHSKSPLRLAVLAVALCAATNAAAVTPRYFAVAPLALDGAIQPPAVQLQLASAGLPPGRLASAYTYDFKPLLSATGADVFAVPGDLSWALVQGALPQGLSLSADGVLSGAPAQTVPAPGGSFTVAATYRSQTAQQTYVFPAISGFSIASASLPTGEQGFGYTYNLAPLVQQDGAPADPVLLGSLSWFVESGALPAGLTLSSSGVLSGTPQGAGLQGFAVGARFGSALADQSFTINTPTKEYGTYNANSMFFSRGQANGSCWAQWNFGAAKVQTGLVAASISDCYVDYGGYRYRPSGALQRIYNDGYQNYEYYDVSRQLY